MDAPLRKMIEEDAAASYYFNLFISLDNVGLFVLFLSLHPIPWALSLRHLCPSVCVIVCVCVCVSLFLAMSARIWHESSALTIQFNHSTPLITSTRLAGKSRWNQSVIRVPLAPSALISSTQTSNNANNQSNPIKSNQIQSNHDIDIQRNSAAWHSVVFFKQEKSNEMIK